MSRWLISVPVWGERCTNIFYAAALPALERAVLVLEAAGADVRVVVHTDALQGRVQAAATQIKIEERRVPAGLRDFDCLSQAHREVLQMGCMDDVVILLTADLVISEQGLVYCHRVFEKDRNKKLLLCVGIRALQEGKIPDTADADALMVWAWDNRHPITEASRYPDGNSSDLSRLYFEANGVVVARLALPHPIAVRLDKRTLRFTPTVDANLMQCFGKSELHIVKDSHELALVELSPRDKDYQRDADTIGQRLSDRMVRLPDLLQRHCIGHRISLVGSMRDVGDGAVIEKILGGTRT